MFSTPNSREFAPSQPKYRTRLAETRAKVNASTCIDFFQLILRIRRFGARAGSPGVHVPGETRTRAWSAGRSVENNLLNVPDEVGMLSLPRILC